MRVLFSPRHCKRGPFQTAVILQLVLLYGLAPTTESSAYAEKVINDDLSLAFLASIRQFDPLTETCGALKEDGVRLVEAAVFIAETVNREVLNWPMQLGLDVIDTCGGVANAALRVSIPRIPSQQKCGSDVTNHYDKTLGVIGLDTNREVMEFSKVSEEFSLPVLTYSASDPALSLKAAYPYLLRTVPCDCGLYGHMAAYIASLNPGTVGIIYEDNLYGERSRALLEGGLKPRGVRSIKLQPIRIPLRESEIMEAIQTLRRTHAVSVVAVVVHGDNIPKFANSMDKMREGDLTNMVLPSGFAGIVNRTSANKFSRSTIVQHRAEAMPSVVEHLRNQCRSNTGRTHWGKELYMFPSTGCDEIGDDPRFRFIADAFFSYAHALIK